MSDESRPSSCVSKPCMFSALSFTASKFASELMITGVWDTCCARDVADEASRPMTIAHAISAIRRVD